MHIGEVSILPVYDGDGRVTANQTIRRRSVRDAWAPHGDLLRPNGILKFPMGGFLVIDGTRRVLVDVGIGPMSSPAETGGEFLRSLNALGYVPEDITDVLFTHLHSDHTGWAVQHDRPVFPRATYRAHQADWRAFGASRYSGLSPITSQLQLFNTDGAVTPSITTRHCPGHTPGSTVFVVESGGERALLIGDIAHSPAQFADEDWYTVWDSDPEAATAVRSAIADEAAATGAMIIPAHFPGLRGGHVFNAPRRFVLMEDEQAGAERQ